MKTVLKADIRNQNQLQTQFLPAEIYIDMLIGFFKHNLNL